MRLRVKIKNAKECQILLPFPDLSVRYNNGYAPALKVAEGQEIPLDVLDPEDVRKSLKVGSLRGYLDNKWIEEFTEEPSIKESPTSISQFITEQMVLAPKMEPIKVVEQPKIDVPIPQPNLPEVAKVVEQSVSIIVNEQITDLSLVKSYEDFTKLSHFLKLRFIKESTDIDLLKNISDKTPSAQFKNNVALRLSVIK